MTDSFLENALLVRILPAPYALSLICRWLFPYLVRKCLK